MRRLLFVLAIAGCGVRTPPRVDVDAILHAKGPEAARFDLEAAVLAEPRDVGAHLALAALADKLGRPTEAMEQLEIVGNLGGPLGIRWHAEDRARLGRLTAARGEARLARGAGTAAADLERARSLSASVTDEVLQRARIAAAIADVRHVDVGVRERGQRTLAFVDRPEWRGARPNATLAERAAYGAWLWTIGAKRGAWGELSAWHDATPAPRDPQLEAAYFSVRTWWTPIDAPAPDAAMLAGPDRCRYGACLASEVADRDDPAELHALLESPGRTREPHEVAAWIELGLRAALRGQGSWGAIVRAHVDGEAIAAAGYPGLLPPHRDAFARFTDAPVPSFRAPVVGPDKVRAEAAQVGRTHVVAAADAVLRGSPEMIAQALPELDGAALGALFEPRAPIADPLATAVVLATRARVDGAPPVAQLAPIVSAFHRDPAIAERLGRDLVAAAVDPAIVHAALGALFEALGDPARARRAWQAAVDSSPEPAFLQGLAESQARAGDPDAALVTATAAAAASGDPGVSWLAVARALDETGSYSSALEAARSAIDLATADTIDAALGLAIDASRALGRDAQVAQLEARRGAMPQLHPEDPTDIVTALAAYRVAPTGATLAHLWVASRWNPRDVASRAAILVGTATTDPRHTAVVAELVGLAGDRSLAADALHALRP